MAVGQAVVPEEPLLRKMRGRPVIVEGTRNDDCVNLAIIAWEKHGPYSLPSQLFLGIMRTIDEYDLDGEYVDAVYLGEKCAVLMEYLPSWAEDEIWDYAI